MPWQADGYSALDFTLLDPHYGTLAEWRSAIDAIHQRGMYVMFDMTTTTMVCCNPLWPPAQTDTDSPRARATSSASRRT